MYFKMVWFKMSPFSAFHLCKKKKKKAAAFLPCTVSRDKANAHSSVPLPVTPVPQKPN